MVQRQLPKHIHRVGVILSGVALLLLSLIFYFVYETTRSNVLASVQFRQEAALEQVSRTLLNYLSVAERDIQYLSRSGVLRQNLTQDSEANWPQLESEWLAFMQSRRDLYDQIRFIDLQGKELARVNNPNPQPYVVPTAELQSKVNRYYVEQSLALDPGTLYLSAFDLNVERGAVELPIKPTLRLLTPVGDLNGLKQGVAVLNYKGGDMLQDLDDSGAAWDQTIWLVNNEGYWLMGPNPELEWSFMFSGRKPHRVADRFPQLWDQISSGLSDAGLNAFENGFVLDLKPVPVDLGFNQFSEVLSTEEGAWTLISAFPQARLEQLVWQGLGQDIPAFVILALFSVALSLWGGRQIRMRALAVQETEMRERQLNVMFESAPDATLLSDMNGRITRANSGVERLLGYRPDELIGQSIDLLVPDHVHSSHTALRQQYYRAPVSRAVSSRRRLTAKRRDGTEVPVSIALNSLVVDGELQVLSAIRDMTVDQKTNEQILLLNQRLEIATSVTKIGIWELDMQTGQLLWDEQMHLQYGVEREREVDLEYWMSLLDEDYRVSLRRLMRETLLDGTEFDLTLQAQNAQGDEIWVRLIATTKLDTNGLTQTLIGTQLDVSEQVSIERELRIAYEKSSEANVELEALNHELEESREAAEVGSRVKSDFLANMSHEIRTPLNAVQGINHLLAREVDSPSALDLIAKQERASQSLLAIINDILDYSKIESGRFELEQSPFSLYELLDNLTTMVGEQARKKGLNFVVLPPPMEYSAVVGDYLRLEQVLVNLCSNAVKFTDRGEVCLALDCLSTNGSQLNIKFSVRDTGVGIPESVQEHLFTPFTQADASVSRRFGGTGLGLSIAANLVKLMGGEISLHSEIGQGSVFSFVLGISRQSINRNPMDELQGKRVVIAAYNQGMAKGIEAIMSAFGANVGQVAEAELVQRVLESQPLQSPGTIILLDGDAYLPVDLQSYLQPLCALPEEARPSIGLVVASEEGIEADFSEAFPGLKVLRYPIGPMGLYNVFVARSNRATELVEQVGRLAGIRILVVDDNSINLDVARMIFEDEGARVWLASDGAEALHLLQGRGVKVDVVLMDVQMPGMDGLDATRHIRADQALADLPVIALTAGVTLVQRSAAMESGMNGFITKPIDVDRAVVLLRSITREGVKQTAAEHAGLQAESLTAKLSPNQLVLNQDYGLRVFKTREKYQCYLHLFVQMYESAADDFKQSREDPEQLSAMVHKMRGGAGHLGIDQVRDLCAQVEALIDQKQPYQKVLDQLVDALEVCFKQIKREFPMDQSVESAMEVSLDPVRLVEPLKTLQNQLQNYDLDGANASFQSVKSKLNPKDRVELQNAIDLFDAGAALRVLQRIISTMGLKLD